ncbi:hypothetical protein DPMN_095471 [Dreissena polymorpha]|uniref:Uncharacterized protein n=1 Tax=Dreissena polymorpha TaxID=45954 RepID=A0A9D4L6J7_DREPO|nr:hypothetical protein DPMN_095471 [Dreissena polymorpha]
MASNVLPDMDDPRLRSLGKQLNRNRKTSLIKTDTVKQHLDVYVKSLHKEQRRFNGKFDVKSMRLKRNLVQARGTQKVLQARREQSFWEDNDDYPYGVYEGESLASYRRQVEAVIEDKHPRNRRKKKVTRQLEKGKVTGRIIDDEQAREQFDQIMDFGRRTGFIQRENPLTRTFLNTDCMTRTVKSEQFWKDPKKFSKMRFKPQYESNDSLLKQHYTNLESKTDPKVSPIFSPSSNDSPELVPINSNSKRKLTKNKNNQRHRANTPLSNQSLPSILLQGEKDVQTTTQLTKYKNKNQRHGAKSPLSNQTLPSVFSRDEDDVQTPTKLNKNKTLRLGAKTPKSSQTLPSVFSQEEDDFQTTKSFATTTIINLPRIEASRDDFASDNDVVARQAVPKTRLRRMTKSDAGADVTAENFLRFNRLKERRKTTF